MAAGLPVAPGSPLAPRALEDLPRAASCLEVVRGDPMAAVRVGPSAAVRGDPSAAVRGDPSMAVHGDPLAVARLPSSVAVLPHHHQLEVS